MPKKKRDTKPVTSKEVESLKKEIEQLHSEAEELQRQVYRLRLEKDVLEKAADIIKKDEGVSLETLTNREKAIVIGALRNKYKLHELLDVFHMAKSSYCYQQSALAAPDKYSEIRKKIRRYDEYHTHLAGILQEGTDNEILQLFGDEVRLVALVGSLSGEL